jgi:hypothetical protein
MYRVSVAPAYIVLLKTSSEKKSLAGRALIRVHCACRITDEKRQAATSRNFSFPGIKEIVF